MQPPFSDKPGRHERHLRRRIDNALFDEPVAEDVRDELLEAQRRDQEERVAFQSELQAAVQEAVDLDPNVDSDTILDLKQRLERLYETASGLAGDQQANKGALRRLVDVITGTIRNAAAGDATAAQELDQEEAARQVHYGLLEHPIVADLLHPDTVIRSHELLPTLLSENAEALDAALSVFDAVQVAELSTDARRLLVARDPHYHQFPAAWQRLAQMEDRLAELSPVH